MYTAVQMYKNFTPLGKGIYNRHAHTVKATGYPVGFFIELAACVETGHYQFKSADSFSGVNINRNTTAIVLHSNNIVSFQNYMYFGAKALHGLVNRIIDYFKNQMMQAVYARGPDIHTRAFAYRFQTFENRNVLCRIVGIHYSTVLKIRKKVNIA
jgi:hypothetical protein